MPTNTPHPFRIRVAGQRTRSATDIRHAEIAMGQMFTHAANGTRGTITHDDAGVTVIDVIGVADTLGWFAEVAR